VATVEIELSRMRECSSAELWRGSVTRAYGRMTIRIANEWLLRRPGDRSRATECAVAIPGEDCHAGDDNVGAPVSVEVTDGERCGVVRERHRRGKRLVAAAERNDEAGDALQARIQYRADQVRPPMTVETGGPRAPFELRQLADPNTRTRRRLRVERRRDNATCHQNGEMAEGWITDKRHGWLQHFREKDFRFTTIERCGASRGRRSADFMP
jgi:hypothetical protein